MQRGWGIGGGGIWAIWYCRGMAEVLTWTVRLTVTTFYKLLINT